MWKFGNFFNFGEKNPAEIEEKRKKLDKAIELMLDWEISEQVKRGLLPIIDSLTSVELDYCVQLVRCLDAQTALRGPFPDDAKEIIKEEVKELQVIGSKIGAAKVKEIKSKFGIIKS
jgi:hypothetical protein